MLRSDLFENSPHVGINIEGAHMVQSLSRRCKERIMNLGLLIFQRKCASIVLSIYIKNAVPVFVSMSTLDLGRKPD